MIALLLALVCVVAVVAGVRSRSRVFWVLASVGLTMVVPALIVVAVLGFVHI